MGETMTDTTNVAVEPWVLKSFTAYQEAGGKGTLESFIGIVLRKGVGPTFKARGYALPEAVEDLAGISLSAATLRAAKTRKRKQAAKKGAATRETKRQFKNAMKQAAQNRDNPERIRQEERRKAARETTVKYYKERNSDKPRPNLSKVRSEVGKKGGRIRALQREMEANFSKETLREIYSAYINTFTSSQGFPDNSSRREFVAASLDFVCDGEDITGDHVQAVVKLFNRKK